MHLYISHAYCSYATPKLPSQIQDYSTQAKKSEEVKGGKEESEEDG